MWLNIVKGMTYTEVAEVLFMSEKSVYTYLSQFRATGSVEPKDASGDRNKGLTEFESFTVLQSILHNPTVYLEKVQQDLFDTTGTWVHVSTICRTIQQCGFTRKKVQSPAVKQNGSSFMSEISGMHANLDR